MSFNLYSVLEDQKTRVEYHRWDMFSYALYLFPESFKSPAAPFHHRWAKENNSRKNILRKGFRGSAKSFWTMVKILHAICYRYARFPCVYCYTKPLAEATLFDVVTQLTTNDKLKEDYGILYPQGGTKKGEEPQKGAVSHFITLNRVKVKAMGIGETPRGLRYVTKDGFYRPDLIILDDIDVDKSVTNIETIDKTYAFIKGELFGGIDPDAQIFINGNTIKTDGVIPRLEEEYKNNPNWIVDAVPGEVDGVPTWPERYSMAEEPGKVSLNKMRADLGETSYNQNVLLIPYSGADSVIKRSYIHRVDTPPPGYQRVVIGVDPAVSTKQLSDSFAISAVGYSDRRYIIKTLGLRGEQKNMANALGTVASWYYDLGAAIVKIEANGFQKLVADELRKMGIAVEEVQTSKDKMTRLLERQAEIQSGAIVFLPGNEQMIEQMCSMPNVAHDDLVDATLIALHKQERWAVTI